MLKALMLAATAAVALLAAPVLAQYDPVTGKLLATPFDPNNPDDQDRWIDPVVYNLNQWTVVPRGFQDYKARRYCPAGMQTYGDKSACMWPRPRAGDHNCALYGNPGLSRCFRPKNRYELRSNDHNTIRSHTSRPHESKIKLDRGCPYLVMQNDGNLVMYDCCFKAIWSTCTNKKYKGTGPFRAVMQKDGNFVIYNRHKAIWHTKTCKTKVPGPYRLAVQEDSNLVVYGSNNDVVWKSGTHGKGCSKNPTCGVFSCPYGSTKRNDKNPNCIRCRNPFGCSANECCVGTCNTFQCPPKTHSLIANPRNTRCFHNGSNCNVRTCCNAKPLPNPLPLVCGNDRAVCPPLRIKPTSVKQGVSCVASVPTAGEQPTYTCTVVRNPLRFCHFHACPVDEVPVCELDFRVCPGTNFQVARDPYNGCQHFPCTTPIDATPALSCPTDQNLCPPDSNGVQQRVSRNRFLNCDFDACSSSNLQQIGGDIVQNQAAQGGGQLSNGQPLTQAAGGADPNATTTKKDVAGFPIIYIVVIALAFVFLMGLIVCIGCQRTSSAEFQRNLHMFGRGSMAGYEMNPGAYNL